MDEKMKWTNGIDSWSFMLLSATWCALWIFSSISDHSMTELSSLKCQLTVTFWGTSFFSECHPFITTVCRAVTAGSLAVSPLIYKSVSSVTLFGARFISANPKLNTLHSCLKIKEDWPQPVENYSKQGNFNTEFLSLLIPCSKLVLLQW